MISKVGHYEPIAREGCIFFGPLFLVALGFWWFQLPLISVVFLVLTVAVALFFRNPARNSPAGEGIILAPADGRVMEVVEETSSKNMTAHPLKRISIFMSIFNVHVNRWPVSGKVQKIEHVSGGFLDAREPAASMANERNSIIVRSEDESIEVVQIAGKIARRIVCWVRPGDEAQQGDRFGLIRFGSRVDVYLPQEFSVTVPVGTRVRAGVTILARKDASLHSG